MTRRRARIATAAAAALGSAALASSAALGNVLGTAARATADDSSGPGTAASIISGADDSRHANAHHAGRVAVAGASGAPEGRDAALPAAANSDLDVLATAEQVTLTIESASFSAADAYSPALQTKLDDFHDRVSDALATIHRINPAADVRVAPFAPHQHEGDDVTVQTNADTVAGVVNALIADIAADHDASVAA